MRLVENLIGCSIDSCLSKLKQLAKENNEECYCEFNGKFIYSIDTLDDAYIRITGVTKNEMEARHKIWKDNYEKELEEHKKSIPLKTEEYRSLARGLVLESELEYWDKIVPIRLNDLYRGMELKSTLDLIRIMRNEDLSLKDRLTRCKTEFENQGHSGMSAGLMFGMLTRFCPNGRMLVQMLREF